jgi:hypothetical protein
LDWSLRSRAPALGLVARRGTGATAARRINSSRRSSASRRLRSRVALRGNHQHALACQAPAGQPLEPGAHIVAKALRAAHVETKLHRARELVDILPTRARGADESLLELALVDADALVNPNQNHFFSK